MVIFHSYVSLPEGTTNILGEIESGKEREKKHWESWVKPVKSEMFMG